MTREIYKKIDVEYPDDLWEVAVKAVIFNPEKTKILLPLYDYGVYGMVGGHLDHGENFDETLRREIKEEIGVDFTGEITEVTVTKREYARQPDNRESHKIYVIYSLILPEDTKLSIEKGGESTVSLDWVPLDDIFSDKLNIFEGYKNAIKKALERKEK